MTTAYHCDDAGDRFRLPFLLVLATNTGGTLAVQFESRGTSKWLNSQVYKYRSISRNHQQKSETADMPLKLLAKIVFIGRKNEYSSNSSMTHWFLGNRNQLPYPLRRDGLCHFQGPVPRSLSTRVPRRLRFQLHQTQETFGPEIVGVRRSMIKKPCWDQWSTTIIHFISI